ncbi:MAG: prolyl oligopeptidase family serine peptidase [Candidatus Heimdallarchaeota archaeon]|nr:prolyl oligopeptidase family serine peptidase [Candidatus Heimdallarchaeota archaeon]
MTNNTKDVPYGKWQPIISPSEVFSEQRSLRLIKIVDNNIYWIESEPTEQGRRIIVQFHPKKGITKLTPKEFDVKSRVHEYGGGDFAVSRDFVYFANYQDQRLYKQKITKGENPTPLTPQKNVDGSLGKYGALELSPDGKVLLFVYEKEFDTKENENFIAAINLKNDEIIEPTILVRGNDFYADPIFSSDGKRIAWLTWNHPYMPWDSTELFIGDFNSNQLAIESMKKVIGGPEESVCIPKFDDEGCLYFIRDKKCNDEYCPENWWNIHRYKNGNIEIITNELMEFGIPLWVFSLSTYDFLSEDKLICQYIDKGRESLAIVNLESLDLTPITTAYSHFSYVKVLSNKEIVFIGSNVRKSDRIIKLNLETGQEQILRKSNPIQINDQDTAIPSLISFPTKDGQIAYANFYPPKNSQYNPPRKTAPPLIVKAHGGPTALADMAFNLGIQFWTSQGYAFLDVNYRGSTGFGRIYRDALLGEWGIIDISDIKDGINYLISEGHVDNKVFIRGGSAGGYAVQRCLTEFPDLFQAGASYYGIGNLITLAKLTHKFESRYLDRLIGCALEECKEIYEDRSPINHLDQLKAPMIIFQGSADKVVPPEVSREMAQILQKKGIHYQYFEYEQEPHGFRDKDNNIDALTKESAFYKKIL